MGFMNQSHFQFYPQFTKKRVVNLGVEVETSHYTHQLVHNMLHKNFHKTINHMVIVINARIIKIQVFANFPQNFSFTSLQSHTQNLYIQVYIYMQVLTQNFLHVLQFCIKSKMLPQQYFVTRSQLLHFVKFQSFMGIILSKQASACRPSCAHPHFRRA